MINKQCCIASIVLLLFTQIIFAAQVELRNVRRGTYQQGTRFVFELSAKTSYEYFRLDSPKRLVLDLRNTRLSHVWHSQDVAKVLSVPVRTGIRHSDDLRMVFSLAEKPARVFVLSADRTHRNMRLVIDFATELARTTPVNKARTVRKKPLMHTPLPSMRKIVVMIDPGHGGKDPGASGAHGVREKNVVLAIATRLRTLINQQPGMQAFLTRSDDHFISLRQRLRQARQRKADIFVSIHADAFNDRRARGSSVYALSQRGATSEAARWLAAKENYSELGGVDLNNKSNLLRSVLLDLSQTATIGSSLQLGTSVLNALHDVAHLHRRRVEQAPFVVLKSPDIPSILVETGFLSNVREAAHLKESWYQQRLAKALLKGVKNYFLAHPPIGTWLASQQEKHRRHIVQRGQTLASIAARYGVSVKQLQTLNHLSNHSLKAGQIIKIPQQRSA